MLQSFHSCQHLVTVFPMSCKRSLAWRFSSSHASRFSGGSNLWGFGCSLTCYLWLQQQAKPHTAETFYPSKVVRHQMDIECLAWLQDLCIGLPNCESTEDLHIQTEFPPSRVSLLRGHSLAPSRGTASAKRCQALRLLPQSKMICTSYDINPLL